MALKKLRLYLEKHRRAYSETTKVVKEQTARGTLTCKSRLQKKQTTQTGSFFVLFILQHSINCHGESAKRIRNNAAAYNY